MQPVLQSNSELALWATLYLIWILVFLVSNVVLMLNIIRQIRIGQRDCSFVLILSLIVSQILIGVVVLPAAVAGLFSTAYGDSVLCKLYRYVSLVSSVACAATLVVVIVVTRTEAISGRLSPCRVGGIVSAVWVVSLVYGTRACVVNDIIRTDDVVQCTVDGRYEGIDNAFSAVDAVILFLLPACVLFWFYVVLAKAASSMVHNVGTSAECSRDAGRDGQPMEPSKVANGTTSGCTSQCMKQAVASEDDIQLGEANTSGEARTATLQSDSVEGQHARYTDDIRQDTPHRCDNMAASDSNNVGETSHATLPVESSDMRDTHDAGDTASAQTNDVRGSTDNTNNAGEASDVLDARGRGNQPHQHNSNDATGVQLPGNSGGVSDSYLTGKTVTVLDKADNPAFNATQTTDARDRNAGEKNVAVNATGNANAKKPETSKEATGVNDNMTGKLHMLIALVACFMLTNSALYVWQVVRYLSDSDTVHDNYRHIDLAVYLFSYSNAWLYALIILYYYRPVFPVNPTLP